MSNPDKAYGAGVPRDNILRVRMFGRFSMTYNSMSITGTSKSTESQFMWLMQMILHHQEEGISRDQLEKVLFGDRDLNNVHHAMRTVIYNAKKRLEAAGLPKVNYIERVKDIYYWTREIPVLEDASEFERLCREAEEAEDPYLKQELYIEACHCYSGEFLGNQIGVIWTAKEARKYRLMFFDCVEKLTALLRKSQDYIQMEEIGLYAAGIHPLSNWETVTMEAMVSMGRYEDARKLYEDTVELYLTEEGLKPSPQLMELLNRLGDSMNHQYAVLDDIQRRLTEEEGVGPGGYEVTYPIFQGIYRMIARLLERGGQSVYLMLCTVVDSKGNPMQEGPRLKELSTRLGDAIRRTVRHSDTITRFGRGQYLVLLVNTTLENCKVIQNRINYNFIIGRQRTGIEYHVNSVICAPERRELKV